MNYNGDGHKAVLLVAAMVYNHLGETGVSLECLRKALDAGSSAKMVREGPTFGNLKSDPRSLNLLQGRTN